MITKSLNNKIEDLYTITEMKRVKAKKTGFYKQADEHYMSLHYIEGAMTEILNIEWSSK